MYELGFHRFRQLPNNVYNMWRRVISSIVKAAFVCPWLSYRITLWINKVHTLSLMFTSKCPNKTAYTTSLPNSLHRPFLWIFSTCSLASNLAASAHWVVIFSKLSVNSPLKPDYHQQSSQCQWEPDEVCSRFRLTNRFPSCSSAV